MSLFQNGGVGDIGISVPSSWAAKVRAGIGGSEAHEQLGVSEPTLNGSAGFLPHFGQAGLPAASAVSSTSSNSTPQHPTPPLSGLPLPGGGTGFGSVGHFSPLGLGMAAPSPLLLAAMADELAPLPSPGNSAFAGMTPPPHVAAALNGGAHATLQGAGGPGTSANAKEALLGAFPCVVLRGLSRDTTTKDVLDFFVGLGPVLDVVLEGVRNGGGGGAAALANGHLGAAASSDGGAATAIVLFGNLMDYHGALQRYSLQIRGRYISVTGASRKEYYDAVVRDCGAALPSAAAAGAEREVAPGGSGSGAGAGGAFQAFLGPSAMGQQLLHAAGDAAAGSPAHSSSKQQPYLSPRQALGSVTPQPASQVAPLALASPLAVGSPLRSAGQPVRPTGAAANGGSALPWQAQQQSPPAAAAAAMSPRGLPQQLFGASPKAALPPRPPAASTPLAAAGSSASGPAAAAGVGGASGSATRGKVKANGNGAAGVAGGGVAPPSTAAASAAASSNSAAGAAAAAAAPKPRAKAAAADKDNKGSVLRMRGLPYRASKAEVASFFKPCALATADEGVAFVTRADGRVTGEAYVRFATKEDARMALRRDREMLGSRYIELFPSSSEEMSRYCKRQG